MPEVSPSIETIFGEAIAIAPPDQRAAFLRKACGDDARLRAEVERLVNDHFQAGHFLEAPAVLPETEAGRLSGQHVGGMIGPYKLLQQIGEGGMGVVYMAEQHEPVARRAALKIIKPGMDSRQVIARFDAERHALALMDHPNIARVLDGGTTEAGRPYFVMELVKGVPITKYCDDKHLSLKERLELMIPVCQAIQHAHQKGIIHRDIKPNNVLVAQYDGRPVPKVIDFGVAKAMGQTLTERTMFTELGQVVGTVEYMSPEQAELNQLDIDTRSDIYSLGVLLYELLTGSTPFDKQKLRTAAFHEMLRIIREDEPPKPSTNLSTSGTLPSIAANRQTEPARLSKAVRGELDWIVMKALAKDRNRRYETANGLASDVQRYLSDEQVQACPPSARYRFGKFARKNRGVLTTASIVALALLLGAAVSTWQAIRATSAEKLARANETQAKTATAAERAAKQAETIQRQRAEQATKLANQRLLEANEQRQQATTSAARAEQATQLAYRRLLEANKEQLRAEANFQKAVDAVDRMMASGVREPLLNVTEVQQVQSRIASAAAELYDGLLAQRKGDFKMRLHIAQAYEALRLFYAHTGQTAERNEYQKKAHQLLDELHAEQPHDVRTRMRLAYSFLHLNWYGIGGPGTAEGNARRAIELLTPLLDYPGGSAIRGNLANCHTELGKVLHAQGRDEESEQEFNASIALSREGGEAYRLAQGYFCLADVLEDVGRVPEAIEFMQKSMEVLHRVRSDSPDSVTAREAFGHHSQAFGDLLMRASRPDEAITQFQAASAMRESLTADFPSEPKRRSQWTESRTALASALQSVGRTEEALRTVDPRTSADYFARGRMYETLGDAKAARADYENSLAIALATAPNDARQMAQSLGNVAWRLVTCPDSKLRDPQRAIELSIQSLQLDPGRGAHQGLVLGVAHYRAGNWQLALAALEKSISYRNGGNCADWFFLAMTYWKLGEKEKASAWYDHAVQHLKTHHHPEWPGFRGEAAELLGIEVPPDHKQPMATDP